MTQDLPPPPRTQAAQAEGEAAGDRRADRGEGQRQGHPGPRQGHLLLNPPAATRSGFLRASLVVPPALEDQAVAALWDSGCLGIQSVASGRARRLTLHAYYPGRAGARRVGGRLRLALQVPGLAAIGRVRLTA